MMRRPWFVLSAALLSHCVYVWKKSNPDDADIVMYIGTSINGVRRLSGHHVLPTEYTDADYVELFPCSCREEARELEAQMIRELKPQLNKHRSGRKPNIHPLKMKRNYLSSHKKIKV